MKFQYEKTPTQEPVAPAFDPLTQPFTLSITNSYDIYRTPPSHDLFEGTILTTTLALSSFRSAQVTVSADWKTLYDQGGLILVLPPRAGSPADIKPVWIKTGIEVFKEKTWTSCVVANPYSDWSLAPNGGREVTLRFEREGNVLWLYVVKDGEKVPVREFTWVFDGEEGRDVRVGVYTCKPKPAEGTETLEVSYKDLKIETA